MIAVAMVDERLCNHSLQSLEVNNQKILYHYNLSIGVLVSGKTTPLEVILSSMVAWVLEVMNDNPGRAKMHLDACGRLLGQALRDSPRDSTSETQDIIHKHLTITHQQCVGYAGYAKMEPRQGDSSNNNDDVGKDTADEPPLPSLVSRIMPPLIPTTQEIKSVIIEYYNQLSLASSDPSIDIAQALRYRRACEIVLMRYRQVTKVPYANIITMHYYLNLANILIPDVDTEVTSHHSSLGGMDYILDRLEESYRTPGLAREYKRDLVETLELSFTKVLLLAKEEHHIARAKSLLNMVQRTGRGDSMTLSLV
ncbi:hypothetical protein DV737_g5358, partial [Chaetothyriales sp. CBS 132003]